MSLKSIVLLSSGLDSTVNLFEAHREGSVLLALTFNYGQRAASKEILSSRRLAERLSIPHQVVDLPYVGLWGQSSLTHKDQKLPVSEQVQIDDLKVSQSTAKAVWVPNRNGVFLNIAAGFAESLGADTVVPGFNLEEAQTFPDNSKAYMQALDHSFSYSTGNKVKVKCWTVDLDKTAIAKRALELQVPLEMMWPCYESLDRWCGQCESCQRAKRALFATGERGFFENSLD